jgi:multidrug efflux pump subunit AcrA (membrane-fusion protein)
VWVVDDDSVVHCNRVVLGSLAGRDSVVVLQGVDVGDKVVVAGVYRLYDGERVHVIE